MRDLDWRLVKKTQKLLAEETGAQIKPHGSALLFGIAFPNTYYLGMSNLGFQTIYSLSNRRSDVVCERFFLPEPKDEEIMRRTNTPLFSMESQTPLYEFDLVGFSISFELDYLNLLTMLELGGIPLRADQRDERHPLVIAGGPCVIFNPEPMSDYIDCFIIGEGEEILPELFDTINLWRDQGGSKQELLVALSGIEGIYVPALYQVTYHEDGTLAAIVPAEGVPARIKRRWVRDLEKYDTCSTLLTPHTEFGDLYLIEIARGCGRHCRFCMAGYCYRKPRVRSLEQVLRMARQGLQYRQRIGLVGAAVSDYPQINLLCQHLREMGAKISPASLRADSLTSQLAEMLEWSGQRTLTVAPEAASERLRRVINKGISTEDLYRATWFANQHGIPNLRLYLMIGLPTEKQEDIEAIAGLAKELCRYMREDCNNAHGKVTLSINAFVPKPFTPFQWLPMTELQILEKRMAYLQKILKGEPKIELKIESLKWSLIQGILSRGDRRFGGILQRVYQKGGSYRAWLQAFNDEGLDYRFYIYRNRNRDELFPWEVLDMGLHKDYLYRELQRALQEDVTPACPQEGCYRCGVCSR